ncbi:MAG: tyrosine-type recombinase/integrase [Candidatus Binataceae bacterium]
MQAKITERFVRSLKPGARPFTVRDSELKGFTLRVRPNGGMSWLFDYRNAEGRRLNYKLGSYPGLKAEGARRQAGIIAGKIADRIDPQAEKKEARIEAERSKVSTLGAFIEQRYEAWALEHLRRGDVAVARLKADFEKWLGEPLTSFNSWRIESWRRDRLKAGTKPTTLNRQVDTLRSCLRKAVDWGIIEKHPLQGLKRLKVDEDERVRFLSGEEEKRLREALVKREADLRASRDRFNDWREARNKKRLPARPEGYVDHVHPLVLLALNTGLRRGELFSLKWADIDAESGMLTVRAAAAKSGDSRRVPLNDEAQEVLKTWRQQRKPEDDHDFVFPGVDGARLTKMNKSWATVCKLAKLSNFRLHDCRHHFASRLVQRGIDLNVVRELMGHADLKMTLRYGHLSPENLKAAVAKLGT